MVEIGLGLGVTYELRGAGSRCGQEGRGQLRGGWEPLPAHRVGERSALLHLLITRLTPDGETQRSASYQHLQGPLVDRKHLKNPWFQLKMTNKPGEVQKTNNKKKVTLYNKDSFITIRVNSLTINQHSVVTVN